MKLFTLALTFSLAALAQTPAQLSFEVASIKPSKNTDPAPPNGRGGSLRLDGSEIRGVNVSLWKVVAMAYGVSEDKDYAMSTPDWFKTQRYDIAAKLPAGVSQNPGEMRKQIEQMMQTLLAERFKLVVHRETKVVSAYALIVGRNGLKIPEAEAGPGGGTQSGRGHFAGKKVPMSKFADFLSQWLDHPVVDKSDLKGVYDIKIDWSPEEANASAQGPSLFTVIEELGLKLESRKLPVEVLIADRAEKTPTEN